MRIAIPAMTISARSSTHGAPVRRGRRGGGLLDPKRTIQIGIRGGINDRDVWRFQPRERMRVVYMEELYERGPKAIVEEARRVVGDGPTYVSFYVDGLDPVYAPGTGTPECGGMSVLEAQIMVRRLQGLNLVGGDVVDGGAAVRYRQHHRAGRRHHDVRDPLRRWRLRLRRATRDSDHARRNFLSPPGRGMRLLTPPQSY